MTKLKKVCNFYLFYDVSVTQRQSKDFSKSLTYYEICTFLNQIRSWYVFVNDCHPLAIIIFLTLKLQFRDGRTVSIFYLN